MITYADSIKEVDVIPTGLFFDKLTGIGGIPRGVITEVFGDEGIGKSSVCLQAVANAQRLGLKCLWVDLEYSYMPKYGASLGIDNSKLGLIRADYAEAALDELEAEITSGKWDLVILDSVGGVLPRAEAEKNAEGRTIGGQATIMAKFCRKVVPQLSIHNVALVVINHSFTDIMSAKLMTSGGKKLAYHKALSIRLKAKFGGVALKQGDRRIGKMVVGEVRKNKLSDTEGLEIESQLIFGSGFSTAADMLGDALDAGIITKKGNTYFFGSEKLGIGLNKVRKLIEDDVALAERIKSEIKDGSPKLHDQD